MGSGGIDGRTSRPSGMVNSRAVLWAARMRATQSVVLCDAGQWFWRRHCNPAASPPAITVSGRSNSLTDGIERNNSAIAASGTDLLNKIPLHDVASCLCQGTKLFPRLHPLRGSLHPKRTAERRHRTHDRIAVRLPAQFADERLTDLDAVEREPVEIAKGRVAGAEIVHRDADPEGVELVQVASVAAVSCSMTVSVISSSSRFDDSPDPLSAALTAATRLLLLNCTGERLTATFIPSGQPAAVTHAVSRTHSPIDTIAPISSASGMN